MEHFSFYDLGTARRDTITLVFNEEGRQSLEFPWIDTLLLKGITTTIYEIEKE